LEQTRTVAAAPLPFVGGWVGFFGYDLAPQFERLPRRHPRGTILPDVWLGYYQAFVLVDEAACIATVGSNDRRRGEELNNALNSVARQDSGTLLVHRHPQPDWSRDQYLKRVERVLEYIAAGDVFQANITQRFTAPLTPGWQDPRRLTALWQQSAEINPAPFSAFLGGDEWAIVSASPERFLLLEPDGRVETRPIKGTRPRGMDAESDQLLADELLKCPKDRAELTMIVDLERNDLGRVCRYGSVNVVRHAALESFSNVHHLVSTVEGRVRPECDFVDLLAATFPGGSITGAPKIRAMQIIDELEGCRRGVYTGSIGYISDHGRADLNIAIRTIVLEGGAAHYHVGGGIVADSDPDAEYEETLTKGARLHRLLVGEDYDERS
jgi:para-aminobenzoate synthetase component 1